MADIVLNGKTYANVEEVMLPDGNGVYVAYSQGGGSSGEDGEDGGYYTPSVTQPDANTMQVAFIPSKADMPPVSARNIALPSGKDGADGADGVGIASIEQTTTSTADGGNNVFTVTLTNGQTATFTVKNGSKGDPGSGATVTVDTTMSSTSTNPVQNKVVYEALSGKSDTGHSHAASDITSGTFAAAQIPSLAASKISAGTFAGQVVAGSSYQTPGTALLRNQALVSSETYPTVNGQINWQYE